ncbi:MAG: molybdopterin-guanine dinucleotide biosynthesis protein A [Pirellulaceae bacterium]|jgi:molybdopterin-guanine dinucleotide biosynthesis protein A
MIAQCDLAINAINSRFNTNDSRTMSTPQTIGGIVLCGGLSTRMGLAKSDLPFGAETLLQRVVRLLSQVVSPIVVVAAEGQNLPALPSDVIVARDQVAQRGPLAGLQAGMTALRPHATACYATSCDVPFLQAEFVRALIEMLADHDIVVPQDGRFHHPLAAVYRLKLVDSIERLIAADRLRPVFLFDEANTLRVDVETLRQFDAELATLENLNHPEDYRRAMEKMGLEIPAEVAGKFPS